MGRPRVRDKDRKQSVSMPANVRPDVRDKFQQFCESKNRRQGDLHGQILNWLMRLDKSTFTLILKEIEDEDAAPLALAVLERIASGGRKGGKANPPKSKVQKMVARAKARTKGSLRIHPNMSPERN